MIKRRFYKQEHGDNSGSTDSSSSDDSDSDSSQEVDAEEVHQPEAEDDEEEEEDEGGEEEEEQGRGSDKKTSRYPSTGSGYLSEDSSNDDDDRDASDLFANYEHESDEKDVQSNKNSKTIGKIPDNDFETIPKVKGITVDSNDPAQADISNFLRKCKSVFKCKLCPRVICLNEATVRAHFASKRHAWSKKLFVEGRLKLMLNSDGELDEEQETHAERHARILDLSQKPNSSKKDTGRQRQNHRRKKRMKRSGSMKGKAETITKNGEKKRHTLDN